MHGGPPRRPPAEDIGGIWGLEEVVYLVTHPEADPPEHFEDLVCHLREKGYDPGAFDPAELTARLSGLTVRTAAKATRTRNGTRRRLQRLNLGEEPPLYRETTQQWLLIDLLTALRAGNQRENLTQDLMEAIRSHADDLWRSDHPATAGTIEATAAAIRDTVKALAKQLRRSAHKARTRR